MMRTKPEISIIIPAFNEEENLPILLENLEDHVRKFKLNVEYIIVDDSSRDGTLKVGKQLERKIKNLRIIRNKFQRGMGNGIRFGIQNARGKMAVTVMADNVDDFSILPEMRRKIMKEGYKLAIGSRYLSPEYSNNIPLKYKICTKVFRACSRIFLAIPIKDITNGYRAYDLEFARKLPLKRAGYEFSGEMTFKTWFNHGKICEIGAKHGKRLKGFSKFSFKKIIPKFSGIFFEALLMRLSGR